MLERIEVIAGAPDAAIVRATREVAAELAPGFEVEVSTGGAGRANVRVNGREIGPRARGADVPLARWMIEASIAHALEPRHVLFLCVANSARSQMAEALARAIAPAEVTISSAGSEPTRIREETLAVLAEIGIDASHQRAKGFDAIEIDTVQLVVTLCAEEACPVVLQPAPRLHWPIEDPAAAGGEPESRLDAFRGARDEIRERIHVLLHG